jgi:hypothetical protein
LKNNSPTEAGQTSSNNKQAALIDALNESFTLLGLNYHNQFTKAYPSQEKLNTAKRLWLDALQDKTPEQILQATKTVIKASEYLPTLKTMLDHCEQASGNALPDPHSAYQEACCAASPKIEQDWSHPIVYFAGKDTGWHFLQNNTEQTAYPAFKSHYLSLMEKVRTGVKLELPKLEKLEENPSRPASEETKEKYLSSLKDLLD